MDAQLHLGQSEDATISQLFFLVPKMLKAVPRVSRVLMQSCSGGVFMMASTLNCSEILIVRLFPISNPHPQLTFLSIDF